jgi:hypothetical protein
MQELWSQTNSCSRVMLARNNRGIVTIRDVTRTAATMEQLSKHISAETNSRNNRRAVFYVRSMPRGYKKAKGDRLRQLSFETPACQDMSLGTEELNWGTEVSELLTAVQLRAESPAVKRSFMCAVQWYLECVIQWDCYSSSVKTVTRKWLVENITDWRPSCVCVCNGEL